jgi:hypothetical protein
MQIFLVCPSFKWQFLHVDRLSMFWDDARWTFAWIVPFDSSREMFWTDSFCFLAYLSSGKIVCGSIASISSSVSKSPTLWKLDSSCRTNVLRAHVFDDWSLTFFVRLEALYDIHVVGDSNSIASIVILFPFAKIPLVWNENRQATSPLQGHLVYGPTQWLRFR